MNPHILWRSFAARCASSVNFVSVYLCMCVGVCNISIDRLEERITPCGMASLLRADPAVSRKWPWGSYFSISRWSLIPLRRESHTIFTPSATKYISHACFLFPNVFVFLCSPSSIAHNAHCLKWLAILLHVHHITSEQNDCSYFPNLFVSLSVKELNINKSYALVSLTKPLLCHTIPEYNV